MIVVCLIIGVFVLVVAFCCSGVDMLCVLSIIC